MEFDGTCEVCRIAKRNNLGDYDSQTLHDLRIFGVPDAHINRVAIAIRFTSEERY